MDSIGIKRFVSKILEVIGNKVANGEWLPIKKGVDNNGNVVQYAVAEGRQTRASGIASHAEGGDSVAEGNYSHAEGSDVTAKGEASHVEGFSSKANGNYSHAEGHATNSNEENSHAEGYYTTANGKHSHAEGNHTAAVGQSSHAEGIGSNAIGLASHAQGFKTKANGSYSHAEGYMTTVSGDASHVQGSYNYNDPSFISMVGVGININNTLIIKQNASVIYVGRDSEGRVDPSNPKNGYQYLIGVGGYQGQAIGTDTKSIQEVIADLESRITALENR